MYDTIGVPGYRELLLIMRPSIVGTVVAFPEVLQHPPKANLKPTRRPIQGVLDRVILVLETVYYVRPELRNKQGL